MKKKIGNFYERKWEELTFENLHHYCSRLALWTDDKRYWKKLKTLEERYLGISARQEEQRIVELLLKKQDQVNINAICHRKRFLKRYPSLPSIVRVLFRSLFSETLYQRNIRAVIEKKIPMEKLMKIHKKLIADPAAIANLSTMAINFFYLLAVYVGQTRGKKLLKPEYFLKIAEQSYQTDTYEQISLQLYLLTHCIIGASGFYSQTIRTHKRTYKKMLVRCEKLISEHYFFVSLDNKFEFLVCAQILGVSTNLQKVILQEARLSKSPYGDFLVDRFNIRGSKKKNNFNKAEHRNVLFIMSQTCWKKAKFRRPSKKEDTVAFEGFGVPG